MAQNRVSEPRAGDPEQSRVICGQESSQADYLLDSQFEIPPLQHSLNVAEPNEIPIILHGSTPKTITSDQVTDGDDPYASDPYGMEGGEQDVEVLHHKDGSAFVNIVPIRLGKLKIMFMVGFSDGCIAEKFIEAHVEPSKTPPAALGMFNGDTSFVFDLSGAGPPQAQAPGWRPSRVIEPRYLQLEAYYYGMKAPIIVDPQFVTFAVKTAGNTQVINLDSATGKVTPLHEGDALVDMAYGGLAKHVCVQVRNGPYSWGEISECLELRHLDKLSATIPLNHTWSTDPADRESFFNSDIEFFTERLSVDAPDHPVGLAQPVRIPLHISNDPVQSINFQQWCYNNKSLAPPENLSDANGKFLSQSFGRQAPGLGGDRTIEIVPAGLGYIEVGIAVHFQDGGFAQRFFLMKVVPSSKGLKKFEGLAQWQPLTLDGRPGTHSEQLRAQVKYEGILEDIHLDTLEGLKFTVSQPSGTPVIEVDRKGFVHALHPGSATVVVDFDGVEYVYGIRVSQ